MSGDDDGAADDKAIGVTKVCFLEICAGLNSTKRNQEEVYPSTLITHFTLTTNPQNATERKVSVLCCSTVPKVLTRSKAVSHLSFLAKSYVRK